MVQWSKPKCLKEQIKSLRWEFEYLIVKDINEKNRRFKVIGKEKEKKKLAKFVTNKWTTTKPVITLSSISISDFCALKRTALKAHKNH